jgi:hypothetical protein
MEHVKLNEKKVKKHILGNQKSNSLMKLAVCLPLHNRLRKKKKERKKIESLLGAVVYT